MDALEQVKQASVFIRSPDGSTGSGYLLAPGRVGTAWHVVKSWEEGDVHEVWVGTGPDRQAVKARLLRADRDTDAAVLAFDEAIVNPPLPVGVGLVRKSPWDGYGFPGLATKIEQPPGLPIDGVVKDADTRTPLGQPAVLLYSDIVAAGRASPLHGFSGSPVVVDGALVGHIVRHIGDADDPTRAAFGYVYACPIKAVTALLDRPARTQALAAVTVAPRADAIDEAVAVQRGQGGADAHAFVAAAEVLIGTAQFERALAALQAAPATVRVRQLRALALAKSGAVDEAITLLEALRRDGHLDAETAGLLAGRYKQRWQRSGDLAYRERSFETYRDAYLRHRDSFTGINAAAMALHCGHLDERRLYAREVVDALRARDAGELTAWDKASLGEGYLLLEQLDDAAAWYGRAAAAAAGQHQNIAVMRRQARLNLKAMGRAPHLLDERLPVPRVLAYTGHMVDADGRLPARLPRHKLGALRRAIAARLQDLGALHGFGTAARGTDIVVLEALAERDLTATVVLPFALKDFEATSVGGDWNRRLHELLQLRCIEVKPPLHDTLPPDAQLPAAFADANRRVCQLATAYAKSLDEKPVVLAVWDGQPGDGPGGTADAVALWQDEGCDGEDLIVIDPRAL